MTDTLKALREQYEELGRCIETLEREQNTGEWLKFEDTYFYIDGNDKVIRSFWGDNDSDIQRRDNCNCFQTAEEAQQMQLALKTFRKLMGC